MDDGVLGRSLGGRTNDHAVLGGLDLLQDGLELAPFVVGKPSADARQVLVGREHQEPPRQGDLRGETGALAAHRILGDLDEHRLARLQHLLDARGAAFQILGRIVDLAGIQDAVAAAADVDERGFHARKHVLHAPQVDVADHRRGARAGDVVLDEHVLLQHRDLVSLVVLGDDHELVGDARRHDRGLATTSAIPAGAPGPRAAGTDASGGPSGRDLLLHGHGLLAGLPSRCPASRCPEALTRWPSFSRRPWPSLGGDVL